ncbi:MAG TPA: hypothetical protein VEP90_30240, partial [Methylomirabilota bacterium]|nr:hypothetical protein [Methylomirabilota bacterium]
ARSPCSIQAVLQHSGRTTPRLLKDSQRTIESLQHLLHLLSHSRFLRVKETLRLKERPIEQLHH